MQGLGSPGGPENPIWTLAKRYDLANTFSNYSNLSTFDQNGPADFGRLFDDYEDAYSLLEQDAGEILRNDYLDRSARAGFRLSGWDSTADPKRASIEWWDWDWEDSFSPEETSELFGTAGYVGPKRTPALTELRTSLLTEVESDLLSIQRREQFRL